MSWFGRISLCFIGIIFILFILSSILRAKDEDKCAKMGFPKVIFTGGGTYCHKLINNTDSLIRLQK